MIAAVLATVAVCGLIVRSAPKTVTSTDAGSGAAPVAAPSPGVEAVVTADGITVTRTLAALSLRLEPGQSLDSRLPAGPFEGVFAATFSTGRVRYARLGAWIEGGSLIVRRRDEILVSEFADAAPRLVMSSQPVFLGSRAQTVTFEFRASGDGPSSLRAMWQPEGSAVPLPLPSDGARLDDDPAIAGTVLVQRHACVSCHVSDDWALQQQLAVAEPPPLDGIASRVRPGWIRRWLEGPRELKATARMPAMLHGGPEDADRREDLVHFLAAQGSGLAEDPPPDRAVVDTGRRLYHEVGCVACHGPLEALDGGDPPATLRRYHALAGPARKTTVAALAEYLEDPVAVHPAGMMPSMLLEPEEARRIAAYLVDHDRRTAGAAEEPALTPDPQRVARGREHFAALGCARCHDLAAAGAAAEAALSARSLERLADSLLDRGCTAPTPQPGLPHYAFDQRQRADLEAFLERLGQRRNGNVPHDALAVTMLRLECVACHPFHASGGPEPALQAFFQTRGEADLGDEGRLPPMLSDAGARLHPAWTGQVLAAGARARPYLATRMPVFRGIHVGEVPAALCAVAGVPLAVGDDGPPFDLAAAAAGRELVGATAMNCIQCHDIAGRRGTGTPGPDLAKMVGRLRYEGFARWLHDPSLIRPGTRMPSFFVNGRSGFTEHYEGDAVAQIGAIWSYLSQGEMLPLPDGMVDPAGLALDVTDEPVVFRTFMAAAGVRAIACGFPEQVHAAFDADRCELAAVWTGPFLNASGAWAARGGSETNPQRTLWTAGAELTLRSPSPAAPFERRFRGYRLDEQRGPVLLYELRGDAATIEVTERPRPYRDAERATMRRRVELRGPAGAAVLVAPEGLPLTRGRGAFEELLGGELIRVTLDGDGAASFELEIGRP
jgi:mono/diheme cytochrome c family protein